MNCVYCARDHWLLALSQRSQLKAVTEGKLGQRTAQFLQLSPVPLAEPSFLSRTQFLQQNPVNLAEPSSLS